MPIQSMCSKWDGIRTPAAALFVLALCLPGLSHGAEPSKNDRWLAQNDPEAVRRSEEVETREVRAFIEGYFRSWSNVQMRAYGECFAPGAVVQAIDARGDLTSQGLRTFLAQQAEYQTSQHATEVPLSIKIGFEGDLARVVARWKLTSHGQSKVGYDHFTLLRRNRRWEILNLVFYDVPDRGQEVPRSR